MTDGARNDSRIYVLSHKPPEAATPVHRDGIST
jgi:hypothetical protein